MPKKAAVVIGVNKTGDLQPLKSAAKGARRVARWLEGEGFRVKLSASYGIANYPQDASNKRGLLHIADNSMYRSKERGKDAITVASTENPPAL